MARTKEFDIDRALDQAVELFWDKGYEATSLRDLEAHMGIGRQSLYDTFGDKKQLFLRALDRYTDRHRARVEAQLLAEDASLPELRAHFTETVRFLTPRGPRRGCLVANSILETGDSDVDVSGRCRSNEKSVTRAFELTLSRAKERGEVRVDLDPKAAATYLMGQVYGLTVLARNGASRVSLESTVNQAFRTL